MKALVGAFNQEKALVGLIVKTDGSFAALARTPRYHSVVPADVVSASVLEPGRGEGGPLLRPAPRAVHRHAAVRVRTV